MSLGPDGWGSIFPLEIMNREPGTKNLISCFLFLFSKDRCGYQQIMQDLSRTSVLDAGR